MWCWKDSSESRRSNPSSLQEVNSEYSLEGLILKLKLQYFGHLMWRVNSLEKTLMLGKSEGRSRRVNIHSESPILWPPDAKNWLNGKDPDAGRDWGQEERRMTEDKMVVLSNELQLTEINYGGKVAVTPTRNEASRFQIKCCWRGGAEAPPPKALHTLSSFCHEQAARLTAPWENNDSRKGFLIFTMSVKSRPRKTEQFSG